MKHDPWPERSGVVRAGSRRSELVRDRIVAILDGSAPREPGYWSSSLRAVTLHREWVGCNWTLETLAVSDDLHLIGRAADIVRSGYPVIPAE